MAASNVTIDDSSSLIVYDPPAAWSHASGSDAQAYVNSTYHSTAVSGASAKFTFNGTGVWFYGAKKPDYGSFVLVVDNDVSAFSNATATKPAFGQLLGGMSELQMGEHVVSIMSGGTGPFDLDAIVYETIDQQPNAKAHASVVQPTPDTTDVQSSQTSPMNPATQSTSGLSTTP
ncbi:hypothetical protein BD414DRAFT_266001 [Trametes punicea]|nr:hypothetical protein BD414DRAFT_266001 [Trametes punicea]